MRKLTMMVALCSFLLMPIMADAYDAESSCVKCHGDKAKMAELGAEAMYLDPVKVDQEVGMKGAPTCSDCHSGDPRSMDKDQAHKGLLRPFLMAAGKKVKGEAVTRSQVGPIEPLQPKGKGMGSMIPKGNKEALEKAEIKKVLGIYYHDRDPETFAYSPKIAESTCGKCHKQEVQDYNKSAKGLMKHQRAYQSWTEKLPGPQNCGAWFGDNHERLAKELSVPYSLQQNAANERACNICHAGCNDCHYKPYTGKGSHVFGAPESPSCYGGGRGSICHAGPMDRRRGAGHMRGEYSFPPDLPVGAHVKNGVQCLDCHKPVNHQFGHLASDDARKSCKKCHAEIVSAVASSQHRKVDCSSCHIKETGAYQFTFWGPGNVTGVETPFGKHKEYYGVRDLPTIIKSPAGLWIPVKPYPMAIMNQSGDVSPSKLLFRSIPERKLKGNTKIGEPEFFSVARGASDVNDAFIIVGTRNDFPSNNKALLWIQIDKMSHALGKARECKSCHASKAQVSHSTYTFFEERDVLESFSGSYTVVADEKGIRFLDMKNTEIKPAKGRKVEDFAPFAFFPDAWNVSGIDFSIPFNEKKYAKADAALQAFLQDLDKRPQDAETRKVRAMAWHNLAKAKEMLRK